MPGGAGEGGARCEARRREGTPRRIRPARGRVALEPRRVSAGGAGRAAPGQAAVRYVTIDPVRVRTAVVQAETPRRSLRV